MIAVTRRMIFKMFDFGKITAERADLIVELRPDGTYRIRKDSRRNTEAYPFLRKGIDVLLFIKERDVEINEKDSRG